MLLLCVSLASPPPPSPTRLFLPIWQVVVDYQNVLPEPLMALLVSPPVAGNIPSQWATWGLDEHALVSLHVGHVPVEVALSVAIFVPVDESDGLPLVVTSV